MKQGILTSGHCSRERLLVYLSSDSIEHFTASGTRDGTKEDVQEETKQRKLRNTDLHRKEEEDRKNDKQPETILREMNAQLPDTRKNEQGPEKVQGASLLTRKILIKNEFVLYDRLESNDKKVTLVPAMFQVLEEDNGWIRIADTSGKSLGWIDHRTVDEEWNSRLVWRPKQGDHGARPLFYPSLADAESNHKGTDVTAEFMKAALAFPVLDSKVKDGKTYFLIGSPLSQGIRIPIRLPLWVSLREEDQDVAELGVMVSERDLKMHRTSMEILVSNLALLADPKDRDDVGKQLQLMRLASFRLISGQEKGIHDAKDDQLLGDLKHVFPAQKSTLPLTSVTEKAVSALARPDYKQWVSQLETKNRRLGEAIDRVRVSSDKVVPRYTLYEDGNKREWMFLPLEELP